MRPAARFISSVVLGLTAAVVACEDAFGPSRAVVLRITAIEAPAEVRSNEELVVRVTIQTGGCLSFTGLDAVKTTGRFTLTARGTDSSGPTVDCPADIRTEVRDVRGTPPHTDPMTVVANQPDGSTTTRTVRVR